jgi:hypothetical protein
MRRLAFATLPLLLAAGLAAATPPIAAGLDAPVAAIPHPDGPLMLRVLARDTDVADRAAAVGELFVMAEAGSGLATYRVATLHRLGDRIGAGVFPRDHDRARSWLLACLPRERCPLEALAGLAEIAHARGAPTEAMAWTQLYAEALRRADRLDEGSSGYLPALIQRVRAADRRATGERAWRPAVDALLAEHGAGIEALMAAAAAPRPADRPWTVAMRRPADRARPDQAWLPRGALEQYLLCAPREGGEVAARVLIDALPEPSPGLDAEAVYAGTRLEVQGDPPAGPLVCLVSPVQIIDRQLRLR